MQLKQMSIFDNGPAPYQNSTSYFDTTKLPRKELIEATTDAKRQEMGILAIYKKKSPLTPSQAWKIYEKEYGPALLTSIRRAITVLTKNGFLTKTNHQIAGPYKNRPEYVWKIN